MRISIFLRPEKDDPWEFIKSEENILCFMICQIIVLLLLLYIKHYNRNVFIDLLNCYNYKKFIIYHFILQYNSNSNIILIYY